MRTRLSLLCALPVLWGASCSRAATAPYVECPATADCAAPWVTIVNGQSAAVSVEVNGVATTVTIASGGTALVPLAVGSSAVVLRRQGLAGSAEFTVSVPTASTHATAVAYLDRASAFAANVLTDSGATPVAGASKLRVIHLAQAAGQLDIFRTQPDWQTPVSLLFPFTYGSNNGFYQSTPGVWHVRAWKSTPGMSFDATGWNRALDSLSVNIPGGGVRTIVVLDAPGNSVKFKLVDP